MKNGLGADAYRDHISVPEVIDAESLRDAAINRFNAPKVSQEAKEPIDWEALISSIEGEVADALATMIIQLQIQQQVIDTTGHNPLHTYNPGEIDKYLKSSHDIEQIMKSYNKMAETFLPAMATMYGCYGLLGLYVSATLYRGYSNFDEWKKYPLFFALIVAVPVIFIITVFRLIRKYVPDKAKIREIWSEKEIPQNVEQLYNLLMQILQFIEDHNSKVEEKEFNNDEERKISEEEIRILFDLAEKLIKQETPEIEDIQNIGPERHLRIDLETAVKDLLPADPADPEKTAIDAENEAVADVQAAEEETAEAVAQCTANIEKE